jgi:hypothetical protein
MGVHGDAPVRDIVAHSVKLRPRDRGGPYESPLPSTVTARRFCDRQEMS